MNVVKSLRRKWSNYCKPKNRRHTCPPVWGGSCRDHDTGREDRGSGGFHFHKKYRKIEKDA